MAVVVTVVLVVGVNVTGRLLVVGLVTVVVVVTMVVFNPAAVVVGTSVVVMMLEVELEAGTTVVVVCVCAVVVVEVVVLLPAHPVGVTRISIRASKPATRFFDLKFMVGSSSRAKDGVSRIALPC